MSKEDILSKWKSLGYDFCKPQKNDEKQKNHKYGLLHVCLSNFHNNAAGNGGNSETDTAGNGGSGGAVWTR